MKTNSLKTGNINADFPKISALQDIFLTDWKWCLTGAIFMFLLASVLMTGWPAGLVPNLDYPFTYNGDGSFITIQRLIEGWNYDNSRSGYPFGSNILDYPNSDAGHYLIFKALSLFTSHWATVLNAYYLLGFSVIFVVAFCVLRAVGISRLFAFSAATIFDFLPFHFQRLDHLCFTWYFVVPLFYYIVLCLFNPESLKEISAASTKRKFLYAAILVFLSSFGVYFAIFGLIILAVAVIYSLSGKAGINAIRISFLAACLVITGLLLNLLPSIAYQKIEGKNPEVAQRGIGESEVYAFKFAQLILPRSAHRNAYLSEINTNYTRGTPDNNENSTATLGIVGSLGLFVVLGVIFANLVGRPQNSIASVVSLIVLVLFMFGTVGGFGVVFAELVTTSARGWNRISIFISFGALLVLYQLLQQKIEGWITPKRRVLWLSFASLILLAVGLWDQTTDPCISCEAQIKDAYRMDKEFISSIEHSLPKNSAIYQLPYMAFPEPNPPFHRLQPYDLSIGFLDSIALRWSYGGMKGREGDRFFRALSTESVSKQLEVIERLGFAGVYIDKRGYDDNGNSIITTFSSLLGEPPLLSRADGEVVFFRLPQSSPPVNLEGLNLRQVLQKADYATSLLDHPESKKIDWHKRLLNLLIGVWLVLTLFWSRRLVIISDQGAGRLIDFARIPTRKILLLTLVFTIILSWLAISLRDSCIQCADVVNNGTQQKIKASYQLSPALGALTGGLDNFPTNLPLANVQVTMPTATTLKAISIAAVGKDGKDTGNWTTQPVPYWWGIGIQGENPDSKLLNYGKRTEDLNLPINRKFTLLIPDNGSLPKCPDLVMQFYFNNGNQAQAKVSCE